MIEIFTKTTCPYCVLAKNWLKENNYQYEEHLLDDDVMRQQFYNDYQIASKTVPQIFNNKKLIGGYTDLISSELSIKFKSDDEDF